jgi:hypothetical protein
MNIKLSEYLTLSIGTFVISSSIIFAVLLHTILNFKIFVGAFISIFFTVNLILLVLKKIKIEAQTTEKYLFLLFLVLILFSALRHADLRLPDEYMYFYKSEDLLEGNLMNVYAQNRYVLHFTYASLLSVLPLNFKSVELISSFFAFSTIFPLYLLSRELFDEKTGIIASLLYAFNPSIIFYSIRFLPLNLSLFLLTSFMYFFYLWMKERKKTHLLVAIAFVIAASMVKLHGLAFLGIALIYILASRSNGTRTTALTTGLIVAIAIMLAIFLNAFRIIQWKVGNIVNFDILRTGYSIYITYLAPDYYTLPFLFAFFLGISALSASSATPVTSTTPATPVKERGKLLFLLTPILIYILIFTAGPGLGVRHFLPVFPYMAIIASAGIKSKANWKLFTILTLSYLTVLSTMLLLAPKIPHLIYVIPDPSLPLRLSVILLGILLLILKKFEKSLKPSLVTYTAVSVIVVACLINATHFIYLQKAYPDNSRAGLEEAGIWLDENTPENAMIQSTTGELKYWKKIHLAAHPNKFPRSTYLDYYTSRKTAAVPDNESELIKRIRNREIDYIVVFTHFILTQSAEAKPYDYVRKYAYTPPPNCKVVYRWYDSEGNLGFVVYKVLM